MPKRLNNPPHPRLSEEEMRRRFNEGRYWDRMLNGEFTEHRLRESADIEHQEILERYPDARSVTARYRNQDNRDIVEVHYYIQYPVALSSLTSGPIQSSYSKTEFSITKKN